MVSDIKLLHFADSVHVMVIQARVGQCPLKQIYAIYVRGEGPQNSYIIYPVGLPMQLFICVLRVDNWASLSRVYYGFPQNAITSRVSRRLAYRAGQQFPFWQVGPKCIQPGSANRQCYNVISYSKDDGDLLYYL